MTENTITEIGFKIKTLQKEDVKSVVDLFVKCFCDSEPITKHLEIRYEDYLPFAKAIVEKAAAEGTSKIALDTNNKIIGCVITEDLASHFKPNLTQYPKLKPIIDLIDELSSPFLHNRKFYNGKVIHIWIAAIDPKFRGQGLSTALSMACVEEAAKRGYDFAYAEFTNEISEKVTHQFNILKLINKINYDDYVDDNTKPFSGVRGYASAYLAVIKPGVTLSAIADCYDEI